jgi:hypothetical protein
VLFIPPRNLLWANGTLAIQQVGIDDIVSLIPFYGDLASAVLQLYQVFLSFLFGIDYSILGWMVSVCSSQAMSPAINDMILL